MQVSRWVPLLLLVAGCASSAEEGEARSANALVLDGAYHSETGSSSWASFKDGEYILWSSDARCADYDNAPADCAEHGTFAVDNAKGEVVFTSAAGKVTSRKFSLPEASSTSAGGSSLVGARYYAFQDLVESGQQLNEGASSVQLTEPGQTQLAMNGFQKVLLACRIAGLVVNPLPAPTIVPPSPPPITQQQCKTGQG